MSTLTTPLVPMVAIVVPCLNEEQDLAATCHSLGFGASAGLENMLLVIVDNGSTDQTLEIARGIQSTVGAESVLVVKELVQGFVPARARGVREVGELARKRGLNDAQVLIIQADADTHYDDHYVEVMSAEAAQYGTGILFEGLSEWPTDFSTTHEEFCEFLRISDGVVELDDALDCDVVIDDKCCGYWLSDYVIWGGHRREYTSRSEEIHAETTRLFMRATARGARRHRVLGAIARHSVRRWRQRPLREFASAGFPREQSWQARWAPSEHLVQGLPRSFQPVTPPWDIALAEHKRHMTALFSLLPRHVARARMIGNSGTELMTDEDPRGLALPVRTHDDLAHNPGLLIEDVFSAMDEMP